jgi:hypothetical protein
VVLVLVLVMLVVVLVAVVVAGRKSGGLCMGLAVCNGCWFQRQGPRGERRDSVLQRRQLERRRRARQRQRNVKETLQPRIGSHDLRGSFGHKGWVLQRAEDGIVLVPMKRSTPSAVSLSKCVMQGNNRVSSQQEDADWPTLPYQSGKS